MFAQYECERTSRMKTAVFLRRKYYAACNARQAHIDRHIIIHIIGDLARANKWLASDYYYGQRQFQCEIFFFLMEITAYRFCAHMGLPSRCQ